MDRWAFMRTWCQPVRGRMGFRADEHHGMSTDDSMCIYVRLAVKAEDATPAKLRAIRDALLLLAMVARVDPAAWKLVLAVHCKLNVPDRDAILDADVYTRGHFRIELSEGFDGQTDWNNELLARFFSELDTLPPNASALAVAMRQIAARGMTDRYLPLRQERLDVPITINLVADTDANYLPRQ